MLIVFTRGGGIQLLFTFFFTVVCPMSHNEHELLLLEKQSPFNRGGTCQ